MILNIKKFGGQDMSDYYELLGVGHKASHLEIQKAYREKARKHHPDKGGDIRVFQKIQQAYEVLSDPVKRQEYDGESAVRFVSEPIKYAREIWAYKI